MCRTGAGEAPYVSTSVTRRSCTRKLEFNFHEPFWWVLTYWDDIYLGSSKLCGWHSGCAALVTIFSFRSFDISACIVFFFFGPFCAPTCIFFWRNRDGRRYPSSGTHKADCLSSRQDRSQPDGVQASANPSSYFRSVLGRLAFWTIVLATIEKCVDEKLYASFLYTQISAFFSRIDRSPVVWIRSSNA